MARQLTAKLVKELFAEVVVEVLVDLGKTAIIDTFQVASGTFDAQILLDNLAEIIGGVLAGLVKFAAKGLAVGVAGVIAEAIAEAGAEAAVETAAEAAFPVAGWVLKGIEIVQTGAQLVIQAVHIASGQLLVRSSLEPAHPVEVVVRPKASAFFPQGAKTYKLTVTPEGRLPIESTGDFDPKQQAVTIACPSPVPLFDTLQAEVVLLNSARETVGHGSTTVTNGTKVGERQEVEFEVEGLPVSIRAGTRLVHARKLEITSSGRTFRETSAGPTADDTALSCIDGEHVCRGLGITLSQQLGVLGYAFETPMVCQSGAHATQIHTLPFPGDPAAIKSLACGTITVTQVALASGEGPSCLVTRTSTGAYGVFPFDPTQALPLTFDPKEAAGILKGEALVRARMHNGGFLVALTDVGVEVVDLSKRAVLGRPADPDLFHRRGQRLGQMSAPVSVAPLRGIYAYALLEQGTRRVQAFDFSGNPIPLWANSPSIALRKDAGRIFLDLDIDATGNLWGLSYVHDRGVAASFVIDVYDPRGSSIVTFEGVNALALAVDAFTSVFAENAENAVGPDSYPEPSISIWTPQNPK